MDGKINVLFFTSEPPDDSSVVHRCKMVGEELKNHDINYNIISERERLKSKGIQRFPSLKSYMNAMIQKNLDAVVIHRSSSFLTYYFLKLLKKRGLFIIYDYDDALFNTESIVNSHTDGVIKGSDAVTAGSHYLLEYSMNLNRNSYLLPTPVDINLFHPKYEKENNDEKIVIGWLGSGSETQLPNLRMLKKPLINLSQKYDIKFKIVSALSGKVRSEFSDLGFEVDFGLDHWVPLEDIPKQVSDFDIGVMPLTNDNFSKGKCAMKAIEYMSMEIPVVASAVGENNYAIKHGYNGFLAGNEDEWVEYLEKLILDRNLRKKIGKKGRKIVEKRYSLEVVGKDMAKIINNFKS